MPALHPRLEDIVEVFDFYDEPVLFVCRNLVGGLFLAVLVDTRPRQKQWLCAPMSSARHDALRRGDIELRVAFLQSESQTVFRVTRAEMRETCDEVNSGELQDDELPLAGERLQQHSQRGV